MWYFKNNMHNILGMNIYEKENFKYFLSWPYSFTESFHSWSQLITEKLGRGGKSSTKLFLFFLISLLLPSRREFCHVEFITWGNALMCTEQEPGCLWPGGERWEWSRVCWENSHCGSSLPTPLSISQYWRLSCLCFAACLYDSFNTSAVSYGPTLMILWLRLNSK